MKRNTPLKAYSGLKTTSSLKKSTPLKSNSSLRRTTELSTKQITAKKTEEAYFSIFTGEDMSACYVTGDKATQNLPIDVHHIFPGSYKESSEEYGYVVPLRRDIHSSCHSGDPQGIWLALKRSCEAEFITHHGTKEEFISLFGRSYEYEI